MNYSKVAKIILWALVLLGFFGGAKISFENFTGSPCPHIAIVPVCYVVTLAYGLMIASLLISRIGFKHYLFCVGWGVAFVIALIGSIAEIAAGGGVCPSTGGGGVRGAINGSIPLCFASLAMLIAILMLFLFGPYKQACDQQQ